MCNNFKCIWLKVKVIIYFFLICKFIIYYDLYLVEIGFLIVKYSFDCVELSYVFNIVEIVLINFLDERLI